MNRRSLSQAINMQDAAVAGFLKAGTPAPASHAPAAPEGGATKDASPLPGASTVQQTHTGGLKGAGESAEASTEPGPTVPVTFRLPETLVKAMIAASADRKIKRIKPYTQQNIATAALEEWLKRNAYL